MSEHVYDAIGIGIGPFNLGFAALTDAIDEIDVLLFDRKEAFDWHPGMLIDGTTLQVPFFADLVSMADVKNKFTFLNYLQIHKRLYHFYFLEKFHIPRKEYNHYCQWVSEQLDSCRFGYEVMDVSLHQSEEGASVYLVQVQHVRTLKIETFLTKHLVMGIGSIPSVPKPFKSKLSQTVFHSSDYMEKKERAVQGKSITVIGSGQSAAEIFLDLAKEQEKHHYELSWYTRSNGFFPMEYSKLGLEYFSPDYTDFFYRLSQEKKDGLLKDQALLYKGISAETISEIYEVLYEQSIGNQQPAHLQAMSEINHLEMNGEVCHVQGSHTVTKESFDFESEVIILGTGYTQNMPSFLPESLLNKDPKNRLEITEDYRLSTKHNSEIEIFVQNGELHTHGVGAPDLGLGAHRNAVIINQIAKKEVYPVQSKNVFQSFGVVKNPALITN